MKVGLLDRVGHVSVEEAAVPTIAADEVLLKVAYAGICGSDLHAYAGRHPFRKPPVVLGHEVSGTVEAIGSGVSRFAVGDAVAVMPAVGCGRCPLCLDGRTNVCANRHVPGFNGWGGGFAEYFSAPAKVVYPLPDGVDLAAATLAEPLATAVHSVGNAAVRPSERVLILGGGTIGLLAAGVARARGAGLVAVTDVHDYNLTLARETFGVEAHNALDPMLEERLLSANPDGFHSVILCTGVESVMRQAMRLVRRGGRVVVTGLFLTPMPFVFFDITLAEVALVGSQNYLDADFREALHLLQREPGVYTAIISQIFPLAEADSALSRLHQHPGNAIKLLLVP